MQVTSEGSVRVDLVGGTLDLEPINLILPNVVTLNVATSLKAKVVLEKNDSNAIEIISSDYNKNYLYQKEEITDQNLYYSEYFKEMSFVLQIIDLFEMRSGLKVTLSSGAPAGSGLGGSSAMGMTLYKALAKLSGLEVDVHRAVQMVKGVEGRILNQGVPGYQDYYPAMVGGVLCLRGIPGAINLEQLYSEELKLFLEDHITLVYSGISRNSGINNWDVYKGFFDGVVETKQGLNEIARISFDTYKAIKNSDFETVLELIGQEGESRKSLAAGILPDEVQELYLELKKDSLVKGIKMCGAGGGGCFILTHTKENKKLIAEAFQSQKMEILDFKIESPL
jgi:D-glycero-alpha-D-manno-heptose-7-phosphate kinase